MLQTADGQIMNTHSVSAGLDYASVGPEHAYLRSLERAYYTFATDDEALVWLYTGRRAVPLYLFAYRGATVESPGERAHRAYLARQGVTHVLLASATGESARALRALLRADPGWLVPVRRWDGGRWLFAVADTADEP